MKIELLSHKFYHVSMGPGDVAEVPDEMAERWIDKGQAKRAKDGAIVTAGEALEDMTLDELRPAAKDLRVERVSSKNKADLIEDIREAKVIPAADRDETNGG